MRFFKFLLVGIFFGIVLVKSEAVSWYRIYEMFRFQSFHMYGIIGTAIGTGVLMLRVSRSAALRDVEGRVISVPKKGGQLVKYIFGGLIFGLGWGLVGVCPGPMFILLGAGVYSMFIVIAAAVFWTFVYGVLRDRLPH